MKGQKIRKISNKLLGWFLLVVLVPLTIAGGIAYRHFSEALKKEVINNLLTIAQSRAYEIETHIKERKRLLTLVARNPYIIKSLKRVGRVFREEGINSPEYIRVDKEIRPYLTFYKDKFEYYDFFFILPSGDIVFSIIHEEDFGTNLIKGPYRDSELAKVFNSASTLLATEISDFVFYGPSTLNAAFIAAPVFKNQGFLGVVAVQLYVREINELVRNYTGLGETGETLLASRTGNRVVLKTVPRHKPESVKEIKLGSEKAIPLQKAALGEKGYGIYDDYRGKKVLAAWRYLPHLRWGMVVKIDTEEAFVPVFRLTRFFLILGITVILAVIVIALFVSRTISRPIVELTKATDLMAEGDLTVLAEVETNDEIGRLARSFNNMVSQHRHAEEELSRLRSLLSNIINSMPSVLVGVDCEGRVTHWNHEAEKVTGLSFDEVHGQYVYDLFPRLARVMERVRKVIRSRKHMKISKVAIEVNGETRFSDVTIYPLIANGIEGGVIRMDDVTERVRMEEMMVQSEKMVSVGGLAAGMAHEINNPLAGILQNIQVMKNRLSGSHSKNRRAAEECGATMEAIEAYVEKRGVLKMAESVKDSGERAARIVENMLSFSRKSKSDIASNDLKELLDKTVELAGSDYDLKKRYDFLKIEIVREYDARLPSVECEGSKIQQVFLNLLKNGAQAMAEQENRPEPPRFILRLRREGQMARIEIEDNGPGMDEETRRRIFEPFFTTREVGQGTGLGLSIAYFIITEEHRGTMRVESAPGKGTVFVIQLPLQRGRVTELQPPAALPGAKLLP